MNGQAHERLLVALPDDLDDAAVVAFVEFFYQAARVLENHYAGQLIRYYHQSDHQQQTSRDDDTPF